MQRYSPALRSPVRNKTRMWVSRLSMPLSARRKDIALDHDFCFHTSVESLVVQRRNRSHLGDRLAPLGHDHSLGAELVKNPQAFCFEFTGGESLFFFLHRRMLAEDQSYDQSFPAH